MDNNNLAALAACASLFGYALQWGRAMPQIPNWALNIGVVVFGALAYAWGNGFHLAWSAPLTYVSAYQWIAAIRGTAAFSHDVKVAPASNSIGNPPK